MNVTLYKSPGASAVNLSFVIIDRAAQLLQQPEHWSSSSRRRQLPIL